MERDRRQPRAREKNRTEVTDAAPGVCNLPLRALHPGEVSAFCNSQIYSLSGLFRKLHGSYYPRGCHSHGLERPEKNFRWTQTGCTQSMAQTSARPLLSITQTPAGTVSLRHPPCPSPLHLDSRVSWPKGKRDKDAVQRPVSLKPRTRTWKDGPPGCSDTIFY